MKNMIRLLGVIGCAFLGAQSSEASVAYCVAKGYVQLDYNTSDWIQGYIGDEKVGLAYYQNFIYGEIKGESVELNVNRNGTITGRIGKFRVRWYTDGERIFGYQPCLLMIMGNPR